jgi:uncharacterized membrane protein
MDSEQNSGSWLDRYHGEANKRANIAESERLPSLVIGGCLVAYGLVRRTPAAVALGVIGAGLIHRGITSECVAYRALGVNNAPSDGNPNAAVRHNEGVRVDKSITINSSPEKLYNFWRDFENLTRISEKAVAVTKTGDKTYHAVGKIPFGRTLEADVEVINDVPNELIAWTSRAGAIAQSAGTIQFRAVDGGTVVRLEVEYHLIGGQVGPFVAGLFGKDWNREVEEDLWHFKQLMEVGSRQPVGSAQ